MRKFVLYGVIIFQVVLIISLVRGIQTSQKSQKRIDDMQQARDKLVEEQKKLKEEEKYVQSPYYLEKVAREELHLSKEGEKIVIVPDSLKIGVPVSEQATTPKTTSNWEKWISVLSGKSNL